MNTANYERMERGELMERLIEFARGHDADVVIGRAQDGEEPQPGMRWSVMLTWGREAPDSPMAGAQALGAGESLTFALTQALDEAGA